MVGSRVEKYQVTLEAVLQRLWPFKGQSLGFIAWVESSSHGFYWDD